MTLKDSLFNAIKKFKGGKGSGNWGHAGRIGKVGGSSSGSGSMGWNDELANDPYALHPLVEAPVKVDTISEMPLVAGSGCAYWLLPDNKILTSEGNALHTHLIAREVLAGHIIDADADDYAQAKSVARYANPESGVMESVGFRNGWYKIRLWSRTTGMVTAIVPKLTRTAIRRLQKMADLDKLPKAKEIYIGEEDVSHTTGVNLKWDDFMNLDRIEIRGDDVVPVLKQRTKGKWSGYKFTGQVEPVPFTKDPNSKWGAGKPRTSIGLVEDGMRRQELDYETVYAYDTAGNLMVRKDGSTTKIEFTDDEMILMAGCIVTHNHPSSFDGNEREQWGKAHSKEDLALMHEGKIAEMRVVTSKRTVSVKPTKNLMALDRASLEAVLDEAESIAYKDLRPRIIAGEISVLHANEMFGDRILLALQEQGYVTATENEQPYDGGNYTHCVERLT